MMAVHLHIPFAEELDDYTWAKKFRQLEWALRSNHLPVKLTQDSALAPATNNTEEHADTD